VDSAAHPKPAEGRLAAVGVVAIGRNEGERLRRCLRSFPPGLAAVVYVDSGSTDDSTAFARSLGFEVLALDTSIPFTAARARNTGIEKLRAIAPSVRFVQVVDGDCEIIAGFIETALESLEADPSVAVVCGRRRELYPNASRYNRLCEMEWNTPVGEASACGGDALIRLEAFDAAGGYDPSLIAGEEPEMCFRIRRAGYRILRIDRDMTRHDAAILRFGQWWKRTVRGGHACAEGYHRHPEDAWHRKQIRSNWFWGLGLPGLAIGLAWSSSGASLSLLGLYGVSALRNQRYRMRVHKDTGRDAALYAGYCVLGKLPELIGVLQFHLNRLRGRRSTLIEYKGA
jgi:glycosyltransferase involved in cell wall biosynthesis